MISVNEALSALFALAEPLDIESVPLSQAAGRVLAVGATAERDQPPFPASAMDGYALHSGGAQSGATYQVIGESAAGHGFNGLVPDGACVRIFTGAPVPDGCDRIIIQEDVDRHGDKITLKENLDTKLYVRAIGFDFARGQTFHAPKLLGPNDVALLAAMNVPQVQMFRKPTVALISTGDELVMPGEMPNQDQIIASNTFGLAAMLRDIGAEVRVLPIARDTLQSLEQAFNLAADTDVVVTIGGASVGDHDLVAEAAEKHGVQREFYKVAMRPGKPLMAGRLGRSMMVGLPGNPVSAMVCGKIFLTPVIRALQGLPKEPAPRVRAKLSHPISQNGPREHYMRAVHENGVVNVFERQDSALLSVLAASNALIVRAPHADALDADAEVDVIVL
jgi:molybdopterin molybdotransferase